MAWKRDEPSTLAAAVDEFVETLRYVGVDKSAADNAELPGASRSSATKNNDFNVLRMGEAARMDHTVYEVR